MLSYAIMTTVDTLFVGHLGASALAGVGLAGITAFLLLTFCFGLLRGVKVLVSQAEGAGRDDLVAPIIGAGILSALALGLVATIAGQWIAAILPRFAGSDDAGIAAASYLELRVIAAPMVLTYVAVRESCYGLGDTTGPMRASLVANVANVALDYLFIYGLGWGVEGAALASVIATALELMVVMMVARRVELGHLRRGVAHLRRLYEVGAPTGFQFLIEVGSFAALSLMISALAEVEMAAHQIAIQVCHFSFLPAAAIGEAASVMTGQAVGANRDDLIRLVAWRALAVAGGYTAACTVVLVAFAPWIASAFTGDVEVVTRAVALLYVAALFQIADAANIVARSILRGTGDVRFAAVVGIGIAWVVTPPTTYLLGYVAGLGALGGWIGLCGEILVGAAVLWHRLLKGTWTRSAHRSRAALAC
jgi:MATE family multidrug resistance protein